MTPNHHEPRSRLLVMGIAAVIASGLVVSGCETVGGGDSGNKRGPFTDPNRPKERPKFKSNIKCAVYASPQGGLDLEALGGMPRPPMPGVGVAAPAPETDVAGDGGGDRDRIPC